MTLRPDNKLQVRVPLFLTYIIGSSYSDLVEGIYKGYFYIRLNSNFLSLFVDAPTQWMRDLPKIQTVVQLLGFPHG